MLFPLLDNLQSAYNAYNDLSHSDATVTRENLQPKFTNYTVDFKGCLDHILINNRFKVVELLELPEAEVL